MWLFHSIMVLCSKGTICLERDDRMSFRDTLFVPRIWWNARASWTLSWYSNPTIIPTPISQCIRTRHAWRVRVFFFSSSKYGNLPHDIDIFTDKSYVSINSCILRKREREKKEFAPRTFCGSRCIGIKTGTSLFKAHNSGEELCANYRMQYSCV